LFVFFLIDRKPINAYAGAKYLEKPMGGRGILLGGVPGVKPAEVLVLGGGIVGTQAAKIAAGFGARVTIMDVNLPRLRQLDDILPPNVSTLYSNEYNIREACKSADLIIGSVLIPGAKAPKLITREMLSLMKEGAVLVDVAIDQGGCFETSRPTTHHDPTFVVDGVGAAHPPPPPLAPFSLPTTTFVRFTQHARRKRRVTRRRPAVHYCVANMPGAVPYTSTLALTNATLPYALRLADQGWRIACAVCPELRGGLSVARGRVVHRKVAEAWGLECADALSVAAEEGEEPPILSDATSAG
jgi:alanine dehydrogenase